MTMRAACLLGMILALGVTAKAAAQTAYDPLQAGEDAYRAGEEQRRAAIDQQRQLGEQLRWRNMWAYPSYAPARAGIYAYGYAPYPYSVYNPRRAYRQALRYGYPPLYQQWPRAPGDIYGYPYYGYARQPIGQEKVWTGPSGYVDRPSHGQPPEPQAPTPASPPRPQEPSASAGEPSSSPEAVPEPIPAPPSEPGPREF